MNCIGCKYAQWKTTKTGRLHPSGEGQCTFPVRIPVLPLAFHWLGGSLTLLGGFILRKRGWYENCPTFAPLDTKENI
jgi:hypothetical protein